MRFSARRQGGLAQRDRRQQHSFWIDVDYPAPLGPFRGDTYVLQPPPLPSELPPRPLTPPEFSSSDEDTPHVLEMGRFAWSAG